MHESKTPNDAGLMIACAIIFPLLCIVLIQAGIEEKHMLRDGRLVSEQAEANNPR